MRNAADEKDINKAKAQVGRQEATAKAVWHSLLQHFQGRQFIYQFLEDARMFSSKFLDGGWDPLRAAYYDGMGDFARKHWAVIQTADPAMFIQMLKENAPAGAELEKKDERSDDTDD